MTQHPLIRAAVVTAAFSFALSSAAVAQTATTTTTPGAAANANNGAMSSSTTSSLTGAGSTTSTTGTTTTSVGTGTAIGPTLLPIASGPTLGPGIAGGFTPYQPAGLPMTAAAAPTSGLANAVAASGFAAYEPANAYGGRPMLAAPITQTDPSIAAGISYTLQAGAVPGP